MGERPRYRAKGAKAAAIESNRGGKQRTRALEGLGNGARVPVLHPLPAALVLVEPGGDRILFGAATTTTTSRVAGRVQNPVLPAVDRLGESRPVHVPLHPAPDVPHPEAQRHQLPRAGGAGRKLVPVQEGLPLCGTNGRTDVRFDTRRTR
jgi:hypothetical protein